MIKKILFAIICLLFLTILILRFYVVKKNKTHADGFTPFRDDLFAKKYSPAVLKSTEFGNPIRLLYRAARDNSGQAHITYHYIWEKEENISDGFGPFLSRNIYTGGLSLQKIIFGKNDIEIVSLLINRNGKIASMEYETAENYNPKNFSVKHKTIEINMNIPSAFFFRVISWNHLFDLVDNGNNPLPGRKDLNDLLPEYFTEKLWNEFEMFKENETFFKRSRAQALYEQDGRYHDLD
ncbi:MAG: hypothetical protein K8R21_12875 [Leptospira sp.]|nr:hypothetical protein [Leptospira sp.]